MTMADSGKIIAFIKAVAGSGGGSDSSADGFLTVNGFESDVVNVLGQPYDTGDVLMFAQILDNGSIRNSDSNFDRDYSVTPLIPVTPGKYALYVPNGKGYSQKGQWCSVTAGYGLWESDGTTSVAKDTVTDLGNNIWQIVVPQNAAFVRFSYYHGPSDSGTRNKANAEAGLLYVNNNWVMIRTEATDLTPTDFTRQQNGIIDKIKRTDGSYLKLTTTELSRKKILVFGDSIWGNTRTNGVADFLHDYSGATVYNSAVGGTRITGDRNQYESPAYAPFDGVNLIHAKLTNTWTDQDANVDSVVDYVRTETLPMLKALDMSTIDFIILAYGTNDVTSERTIAQIQTAYETAVSEILTAYPGIRILIIAPPWRTFSSGTVDGDDYENGNGDSLRDIADGIIENAKAHHIACINMLDELPWRAETLTYYISSDKVHPNLNGNQIYAHVVNGKLQSML